MLATLMMLKGQVVSLINHKELWVLGKFCLIRGQSVNLSLCSPLQGCCNQLKAQHYVLIPSKCSMDELDALCKVQTCINRTLSEHRLSKESLSRDQPRTIITRI